MIRTPLAVALAVLVLMDVSLRGVTEVMTDRDISYALAIANGSDATRALFHAPYTLTVTDPTVEHVEVVTEFRRFVLMAEEQLKSGNWMMGRGGFDAKGRSIRDVLRPLAGQVSIRARLRFHPHNSYKTLPPFDLLVGEPTLLAISATRTPHIATITVDGGSIDVIHGATIETFFNAPTIEDRVLPVRMMFEGSEIARVSFDFARVQ
jgi:hypothetical protein